MRLSSARPPVSKRNFYRRMTIRTCYRACSWMRKSRRVKICLDLMFRQVGYSSVHFPELVVHAAEVSLDADCSTCRPALITDDDSLDGPSQGVLVCIGGLGMLVASDELTDKDYPAISKVKGDIFMIVGASLYGFCMSQFFALFRLREQAYSL